MVEYIKITCRKNSEQQNQNRRKIAESTNFVYLVMFIELDFRQSNIVSIRILFPLIVKTNIHDIF